MFMRIGKKPQKPPENSIILASGAYLPDDRGRSILFFGSSGSGKHFYYAGPNIMQCNTSYVVTDPSGRLYQQYGKFLETKGYKVRCLNLARMDKGNHYNPFRYIHNDKDVVDLVNALITNTTPRDWNAPIGESYYGEMETMLLTALITYLHKYGTYDQQNFSGVMGMLRTLDRNRADRIEHSGVDALFDKVRSLEPESFMVKQFDEFCLKAKTEIRGILISCAVRLQAFDFWDVQELTKEDDINLEAVCKEKTALFIITPTSDTSFNFIAAMMYTQLFDILARYGADGKESAIHTHLLLNEPEMTLVPDFGARIETAKKCGVTTTLFVHTPEIMAKAYSADWENISEKCDAAILASQQGGVMDWFYKYTGMVSRKEDGAGRKRFFGILGRRKTSNEDAGIYLEDIRMLSENECLVAVKGAPVKKMLKYAAKNHPSWSVVKNER